MASDREIAERVLIGLVAHLEREGYEDIADSVRDVLDIVTGWIGNKRLIPPSWRD